MQITIQQCDGCETPLALAFGVRAYHKVDLSFSTYMIDENTGMEEEVPTMRRRSYSLYCEECFERLVNHMNNFVEESGRTLTKQTNTVVEGESKEIGEFAKSSQKARKNFKASEGSQPAKEEK